MNAALLEHAVAAMDAAYEANDHGLEHEDLARAVIAAHIAYLAGPTPELSADASGFLAQLAERASAERVLDAWWWTALASMLVDGWRVLPPAKGGWSEPRAAGSTSDTAAAAARIRKLEDALGRIKGAADTYIAGGAGVTASFVVTQIANEARAALRADRAAQVRPTTGDGGEVK